MSFGIQGPKGDTGARGPQGATGPTGPRGPAGASSSGNGLIGFVPITNALIPLDTYIDKIIYSGTLNFVLVISSNYSSESWEKYSAGQTFKIGAMEYAFTSSSIRASGTRKGASSYFAKVFFVY